MDSGDKEIFVRSLIYCSSISLPMISISSLLPLNLISLALRILLTSAIVFLSCGAIIWAPSSQYALYPLYSFGLCEAVRIIPLWHPNLRMVYDISGVGRRSSNRYTLMPFAEKMSAEILANLRLLLRQSWPMTTLIWSRSANSFFR